MTGFAGFFPGNICSALDTLAARLLVKNVAAFAAQALLEHDVRLAMGDSFAALTRVKDFLGPVGPGMAGLAVGQCFDVPDDLVLDLEVALVAFDFMERDVIEMDEIGIAVFIQPLFLKMAFVTVLPGDGPVPDGCPAVAFVAGEVVGKNDGVIKTGRGS